MIEEDSVGPNGQPLWSCREMSNRICGEGNSEGVSPGYYGVIDNDQ